MYTINPMPEQVAAGDLQLLSGVETATVGHWRFFGFMHRSIQPLLPKRRVVGTAVTIAIPGPDSTLLHHVTGMLRPGDILVVDRMGDDRYACWGGGVTIAAKASGAVAGIVDGPCTDLTEIEDSDFPMWARVSRPSPPGSMIWAVASTFRSLAAVWSSIPVMPFWPMRAGFWSCRGTK